MSKPRFTITITDNLLDKVMTIGSDKIEDFKKKGISGKPSLYEYLDKFEEKDDE